MNATTEGLEASAADGAAGDAYAAVYHQLQHTVQRLVYLALDHARRGTAAPEAALASPLAPRAAAGLSAREHEVLQRIVAGDSNKMIARTLNLSPHTVKRHVANILDKLGARSRAQAAAWLLARH